MGSKPVGACANASDTITREATITKNAVFITYTSLIND
jgi:hypothetical protein